MKTIGKFHSPIIILASIFFVLSSLNVEGAERTITLYYSNNCSHCHKVIAYLRSNNISIQTKNISSPRYREELRSLGIQGVPALKVGSRIITGSDPIINYLSQQK